MEGGGFDGRRGAGEGHREVGDQHHGGADGGRNQGGALDEELGDTQKSIHGGGAMVSGGSSRRTRVTSEAWKPKVKR